MTVVGCDECLDEHFSRRGTTALLCSDKRNDVRGGKSGMMSCAVITDLAAWRRVRDECQQGLLRQRTPRVSRSGETPPRDTTGVLMVTSSSRTTAERSTRCDVVEDLLLALIRRERRTLVFDTIETVAGSPSSSGTSSMATDVHLERSWALSALSTKNVRDDDNWCWEYHYSYSSTITELTEYVN